MIVISKKSNKVCKILHQSPNLKSNYLVRNRNSAGIQKRKDGLKLVQ